MGTTKNTVESRTTDALATLAYDRLRAIAGRLFASMPVGHTLQPTAVVHEAYLKVAETDPDAFVDFGHFVNVAAQAMRQVLVDYYRQKRTSKRGGDQLRITLLDFAGPTQPAEVDVLALDAALTRLSRLNERQARVVELKFFGGFSMPEISTAIGASLATVERDWRRARAWLQAELDEEAESS